MGLQYERTLLKRMYPGREFALEVNRMSDKQIEAMMVLYYKSTFRRGNESHQTSTDSNNVQIRPSAS